MMSRNLCGTTTTPRCHLHFAGSTAMITADGRPVLRVTEKPATYGELLSQGSDARRPTGLRLGALGNALGCRPFHVEEDTGATHRSSTPRASEPQVSSPAPLAKVRAQKASTDLITASKRLQLDELARLLSGRRLPNPFLLQQTTISPTTTTTDKFPTKVQISRGQRAVRQCSGH